MNTIILLSSLLSFPLKRKPNSWKNGIYSSYQSHTFFFVFSCSNCKKLDNFCFVSTRWSKTHNLLVEGGLTYDAIKQSVADSSIAFRDGVVELFEFLEVKKSNSGLIVVMLIMVKETSYCL